MLSMEDNPKKRPFFSSPDDLFDEEYYDEQSSEKKRRLNPEQVHLLEESFETENKLEPERKTELAKKLGLQPRQVAVWFQNRRARWKTKQLERDYDVLKASYDSLLSNYESVVKENEKLKSEVVSLTGKLQANEIPTSGQQIDIGAVETPDLSVHQSEPLEDRLSSMVDEDGPQFVDSCDSYFPDDYAACVISTGGIPSEEDDGSDDGHSYFSDVFATTEQQLEDGGEPLDWWVWS